MEKDGERQLFFFNDTATTEIYTLSLHDRSSDLSRESAAREGLFSPGGCGQTDRGESWRRAQIAEENTRRSEEHTSELQSQSNLVCRLLLEKTKTSISRESQPLTAVVKLEIRRPI